MDPGPIDQHTVGGSRVIGGSYTKAWGVNPAGGELTLVGGPGSLTVGGDVAFRLGDGPYSLSVQGVVTRIDASKQVAGVGETTKIQVADDRILLSRAQVFGSWNIQNPDWNKRANANDGFANRRRFYSIRPGDDWKQGKRTYHNEPKLAREILEEAFEGAEGLRRRVGFSGRGVLDVPLLGVDAHRGMRLSNLISRINSELGTNCYFSGSLKFFRPGEGNAPIVGSANAVSERRGKALVQAPETVRVVGDSNLVQSVVTLDPDWNTAWERFHADIFQYLEFIGTLFGLNGDTRQELAERQARAMSVTVAEVAARDSSYADERPFGDGSRMGMPAWLYVQKVVFGVYRVPSNAEIAGGLKVEDLRLHPGLLVGVELANDSTGSMRVRSPLQYYPSAKAHVVAQGQSASLIDPQTGHIFWSYRTDQDPEKYVSVGNFTLDPRTLSVQFSKPLYKTTDLFLFPNQGKSGLSSDSDYWDIVVPNPDFSLAAPGVKACLTFELGVFTIKSGAERGSHANHYASGLAMHLLDGTTLGAAGSVGVDLSGELPGVSGLRELPYQDGETAGRKATEIASKIRRKDDTEESGVISRAGLIGASLADNISRVTTRLDYRSGLTEDIELTHPSPGSASLSEISLERNQRTDDLFPGQAEQRREAELARFQLDLVQASKGPDGATEEADQAMQRPVLNNGANPQLVPNQTGEPYRAGEVLWLGADGLPSVDGQRFGGVTVRDESAGAKLVAAGSQGIVPVLVQGPFEPGDEVGCEVGNRFAQKGGERPVGTINHHEPYDGNDQVLAYVRLFASQPKDGQFKITPIYEESGEYSGRVTVGAGTLFGPSDAAIDAILVAPHAKLEFMDTAEENAGLPMEVELDLFQRVYWEVSWERNVNEFDDGHEFTREFSMWAVSKPLRAVVSATRPFSVFDPQEGTALTYLEVGGLDDDPDRPGYPKVVQTLQNSLMLSLSGAIDTQPEGSSSTGGGGEEGTTAGPVTITDPKSTVVSSVIGKLSTQAAKEGCTTLVSKDMDVTRNLFHIHQAGQQYTFEFTTYALASSWDDVFTWRDCDDLPRYTAQGTSDESIPSEQGRRTPREKSPQVVGRYPYSPDIPTIPGTWWKDTSSGTWWFGGQDEWELSPTPPSNVVEWTTVPPLFLSGEGEPDVGVGVPGDWYRNELSGTWYEKQAGTITPEVDEAWAESSAPYLFARAPFSQDTDGDVPGPTSADISAGHVLDAAGNWVSNTDTTYPLFGVGLDGIVPGPDGAAELGGYVLRADGAWVQQQDTTYGTFGESSDGLVPGPTSSEVLAGKVLGAAATWVDNPDTTYGTYAESSDGLVPGPTSTDVSAGHVLDAGGAWVPQTEDTTYGAFSESSDGLVPGPTSSEISSGRVLQADGTWVDQVDTNTTYGRFAELSDGLVPGPTSAEISNARVLQADGAWVDQVDTNTTYGTFSESSDGLVPGPTATDISNNRVVRADGTWGDQQDTTYGAFGESSDGLVPGPTSTEVTNARVLQADGAWVDQVDTNTTYPEFSEAVDGLVPGPTSTEISENRVLRADGTWIVSVGTDDQTLSYTTSTRVLAIENGNSVTLPLMAQDADGFVPGPTSTEISENRVLRADGTWVVSIGTDDQTLSYTTSTRALAIENGNTVTLPLMAQDTDGLVPGPTSTDVTNDRVLQADGTWVDQVDTDTTYGTFSESSDGLVPGPTAADIANDRVVRADGTWGDQVDTNTTYGTFSESSDGLVPGPTATDIANNRVPRADGTWVDQVDTDTTYGTFSESSDGLVPGPTATDISNNRVVRADGSWGDQEDTTYGAFAESSDGLVPGPTATDISNGLVLRADGSWVAQIDTDTTYGAFAESSDGLVPGPTAIDISSNRILQADGSWVAQTDTNTTYPVFSQNTDGLMPGPTATDISNNRVVRADGAWVDQTVNTDTTYGAFAESSDGLVPGPTLADISNNRVVRADGTWVDQIDTDTTYERFAQDADGLVPGPTAGEISGNRVLRADGSWVPDANTDTTYGTFAESSSGLVPGPTATDISNNRVVRADGTWVDQTVNTDTTYPQFTVDTDGLVPGPTASDVLLDRVLQADGQWVVQVDTNTTYGVFNPGYDGLVPGPTSTDYNNEHVLNAKSQWVAQIDTDTTYGTFAESSDGLVPGPTAADIANNRVPRADGTWVDQIDTNTTYGTFAESSSGLVPGPTSTEIANGEILQADGMWVPKPVNTDTTYGDFAESSSGLVPGPTATDISNNRVVRADGTWVDQTVNTDTTYDRFAQDTDGLVPGPTAGEISGNRVLRADGSWVPDANTDTTYGTFAESSSGLVPGPTATDISNNRVVRADGTWVDQTVNTDTTYPEFSQDTSGLVPGPTATDISNNRVVRADGTWVDQTVNTDTTYGAFAESSSGLVPGPTATDISNNYVLQADGSWTPQVNTDTTYNVFSQNVHGLVPGPTLTDINTSRVLRADGAWVAQIDTNTTYGVFSAGNEGLVPGPTASDVSNNYVLRADGDWVAQIDTDTTYPEFSQDTAGLVPGPTANDISFARVLRADGDWVAQIDTNTTYGVFAQEADGLVPGPTLTDINTSRVLRADGTWVTQIDTDTTYPEFSQGTAGLVPGPTATDISNNRVLRADGDWVNPSDADNQTLSYVTSTSSLSISGGNSVTLPWPPPPSADGSYRLKIVSGAASWTSA